MRRDLSELIIQKLGIRLGEYELRFHVFFIQHFCGGNITSFEAGNIFSLVKSGMVLILLKHYVVSSHSCVPIQSLMKCDTVSSLLVPHERVKLTVESFCLPDPSSKESASNGWFSYLHTKDIQSLIDLQRE